MLHKIRLIIVFIVFVILCFLGITNKGAVETNLLKTLLPHRVVNSTDIVSITNKSSSIVKVVFESDNQTDLDKLKQDFTEQINNDYFELNRPDVSKILDKYISQPANFLSKQTKQHLVNKDYDIVYSQSLERLYSPVGVQLTTIVKDPYLLLDDFIMSNLKFSDKQEYFENKYYDYLNLKLKNTEALSPNLSNQKVKQLINLQKKLSTDNSKIYLAGVPVHSYYTSMRSMTDINLICILSTLMIIFLTYRYFRNLKLLIPIALSITFGMLLGYVATKLWFDSFQVITMVFSTTLIGIGIDYSYHYFFSDKINKKFIKNLSFSLLTTILPFVLLYFTGIELLKQVAVFTIFGLVGIYFVVLFLYPCFKFSLPIRTYNPNYNLYKIGLIILFIFSLCGLTHFQFNDNLNALYNPSKTLSKAELLYSKISGENTNTQIIIVKGDDISKIIATEEKITDILDKKGIKYIALSKYFPSKQRQQENFSLVKDLYNNNLDKYSNILSAKQIQNLKNTNFVPVDFDYSSLQDYMLNKNTSIIITYDTQNLNIQEKNTHIVNIQSDIKQYMQHYRYTLMYLFPVVLLALYILLSFIYDCKKAVKILTPSLFGVVLSMLMTTFIHGELNLFSIITIFLIIGFTIDYSIFRINKEEKTESAVFVSCITTSFAFFLLSLCGFKMLSSMALMLFFGIVTSYIVGYLIFERQRKINS